MSMDRQGTVTVHFTIGFGNNLFQYVFARLLAEHHGLKLNHPHLPGFNFPAQTHPVDKELEIVLIRREGYQTGIWDKYFQTKTPHTNYDLLACFEDYTIYKNHLDSIRSWFPPILSETRNTNDLLIHIRLQNRLVQLNHHMNFITGDAYTRVLKHFEFDQLHIVTDAAKWDYYTKEDVEAIQKDIMAGPNPGAVWVPTQDSVDYMNELVESFKPYDPIVHCTQSGTITGSGGLRDNFMDSFNLIRSFDQVVLYNSTFSWWAAVLGAALKVGVFGLWKPGRDDKSPNLGQTNYPGWFSWGNERDLIYHRKKHDRLYNLSWESRHRRSRWRNRYFRLKRRLMNVLSFDG